MNIDGSNLFYNNFMSIDYSFFKKKLKRDVSVNGVLYLKDTQIEIGLPQRSIFMTIYGINHSRSILFNIKYKDAHTILDEFVPYDGNDEISPTGRPCEWRGTFSEFIDEKLICAWKHVKGDDYVSYNRSGVQLGVLC